MHNQITIEHLSIKFQSIRLPKQPIKIHKSDYPSIEIGELENLDTNKSSATALTFHS